MRKRILASLAGVGCTLLLVSCGTTAGPAPGGTTRAAAPEAAATQDMPSNIPFAFRLDDVQTYWKAAETKAVYDFFLEQKTALSLGIIAGTEWVPPESWGPAGVKNTVEAVKAFQAAGVPVEVASHSATHPENPGFQGKPLDWQMNDLETAQQRIFATMGVYPKSFIPPTNHLDANTYLAMKSIDHPLSIVSGQCSWPRVQSGPWPSPSQSGPSGNSNYCTGQGPNGEQTAEEQDGRLPGDLVVDGSVTVPAGAVLDSWADYDQPADLDDALGWIKTQYENQGFAVIMLHPQELSSGMGDSGKLNPDKVQALKDIISIGKSKNWNFTTFSGLADLAGDSR